MKKLLAVLLVLVMVLSVAACGGGNDEVELENPVNFTIEVAISVDDAAADFEGFTAEYAAEAGSSVLDATSFYCQNNDKTITIVDEYGGYVTELAGLTSGDYADNTAWVFYLNGESPTVGAGDIELNEGDVIKWEFIKY